MSDQLLIAILVLTPLIGFLINGFGWKQKHGLVPGIIATVAVAIPFLCAVTLFFELVNMPHESRTIHVSFFDWFDVGSLKVPAGFLFDQLSANMTLIITGVGTLIHIFSIGYMGHDARPAKYFAYLNLFIFNMCAD